MAASYDELLASATHFHVKQRTEFKPETDEAWRLTVRQEVKSKAGLKQLGRSVLVFDFQPASTITASNSPSTPQRSTNAGGGGGRNMDGTAESMGSARETVAGAGRVGGEGGEGGEASRGGGAGRSTASDDDDDAAIAGSSSACCVVFVHDRYNGSKQLYKNRRLVYSVKKECTDGSMNSWVLPLPFGRAVLSLTSKLFSSSGFEYCLALGKDGSGSVLYKSTQ